MSASVGERCNDAEGNGGNATQRNQWLGATCARLRRRPRGDTTPTARAWQCHGRTRTGAVVAMAGMNTVRLEAVATDAKQDIPMQPTSLDIWDKKYRLKTKQGEPLDADIDGTYQRVARALAAIAAQSHASRFLPPRNASAQAAMVAAKRRLSPGCAFCALRSTGVSIRRLRSWPGSL